MMAYKPEKKMLAFSLYCQDVPITDICTHVGIKVRKTVYAWIRKDDWERRKREINRLSREKGTNLSRDKHLNLIKSIMSIYAKAVSDNPDELAKKITFRDVMEAIKVERLIEGEVTERQEITPAEQTLEKIKDEYYEIQRKRKKRDFKIDAD